MPKVLTLKSWGDLSRGSYSLVYGGFEKSKKVVLLLFSGPYFLGFDVDLF